MISPGHVLLTGASAGIGEALARAYAAQGLKLTLVARREDKLLQLAAQIKETHPGAEAEVIAADLSDPQRVDALVDEAEARSGPVDHLVNNAGMQVVDYGYAIDPDEGERLLKLNLLTPLRLIRRCLPGMRDRGTGSVVNISSVAAFASPAGMAWYSASKAGLAAASETLHGELRGSGVHVVTVYPGPVHTALGDLGTERLEETFGQKVQVWGQPEVLAELVLKAIKKKNNRVVYPSTYGPLRHTPGIVRWALDRFSPGVKS